MDTKNFRSIIKDMPKRASLTRSDLTHSLNSINNNSNNNDDINGSSNIKPLKDNCSIDEKKKKRNLLNIKKIFERNNTNGSMKNKRNSELFQSENEFDDVNSKKDYVNGTNDYYDDTEFENYSNTSDDEKESFFDKRYDEIIKECYAEPNIKLEYTNREFIQKNKLFFNYRIVLTNEEPQIIHKTYFHNSFSSKTDIEELENLLERFNNLQKEYIDLNKNIISSINYNLYQAYKAVYKFIKETEKMDNLESSDIVNIISDLDNPNNENELTNDIMSIESKQKKKNDSLIGNDIINENNTIITPEIATRRKSVITRMYNVKNRSFLFKTVAMDGSDNESNNSSVLNSPILFEEPDDIMISTVYII